MKVLLVDDDAQSREILRLRLEQAGYEVAEADNGETGLAQALAGAFDLVVLDVMMPKKNGWQVCKAVKSSPRTKATPVLILTARLQEIDELQSWECGADEYLTKPVDPAGFMKAVLKMTAKEGGCHAAGTEPKSQSGQL